ncbi:MAG: hypothetical protein DSY42_01675 [Aquifex sp.]|nr:MAG: hypothetical protein DSY42_01675 [Aquifex sp.]
MKFFKERKSGEEGKENRVLEIKPLLDNFVVKSFLKVIVDEGDEEDIYFFQEQAAENFYSYIKPYMEDLKGNVSVEFVVKFLNLLLLKENLGNISIEIDMKNKKLKVMLYNSVIAKSLDEKFNKSMCRFYEVLFSKIFSHILEEEITLKEVKCSLEQDKRDESICIFENI